MAKRDRDHSGIAGADDDSQHGVLSDGNDDGDDDYEVVMRAEVEGDGGDAHGGNVHGGEADEDDGDDEVLGATHDVLPAAKPRRPSQAWAVTDVRNLEAAVRAHGEATAYTIATCLRQLRRAELDGDFPRQGLWTYVARAIGHVSGAQYVGSASSLRAHLVAPSIVRFSRTCSAGLGARGRASWTVRILR